MAPFGNLFGKKSAPQENSPAPKTGLGAPAGFFPEGVDMSDWDQAFSACLGKMYTVQHAFLDMVRGEEGWYIDFEKGALTAHFDTDVVVEFEQAGENYRIKNLKQ